MAIENGAVSINSSSNNSSNSSNNNNSSSSNNSSSNRGSSGGGGGGFADRKQSPRDSAELPRDVTARDVL
ncbi:unnamed protein product [Lampetra planeri]